MIFIDSNIPMYLVGASHPLKADAQILLERVITAGDFIVTDAEVLQEIIHRYAAINKRQAIDSALAALLQVVDEVFAIEKSMVMRAAEIVQHPAALSARDALHIASMEQYGVTRIMSFDRDYDRWPKISRIHEI